MEWSVIKPALVALFAELALDQSGPKPEWQGRPRSFTSDHYRFATHLAIPSVTRIGPDEPRYTEITVGGQTMLRETIYGHRRIVLRVNVEGVDNTDDAHPLHVAEKMRTRLARTRSREALEAVSLFVTDTGPALTTDYTDGGRKIPRATFEVTMLGTSVDADPIPMGWIEAVVETSHIKDTNGTELPVPPNVVDRLIPEG